ncbi:kinesin-like protein KIF20B isoform X1 [Sycon ciliatum]|uniref:kinesin-like protein KIF20B isoform X1 n=1 Tax=Sycon ciliatum TaxID=27933 RepID=UPI0031F65ED9
MANPSSDISPTSQETEYTAADHSDICKRLTFGNFAPPAEAAPAPRPNTSTASVASSSAASSSHSSSVVKDVCQGEALHCFLRIRPFTDAEQKESASAAKIDLFDDGHQIEIHAPEESATFKNGSRNPAENSWRFKFSSVLSPSAGQQDVFETTLLENVQDFVTGQNTLVFTYGATNGGKTYTMLGKPSDAGLIPRTLDTIFNSIKDRLGKPYEMKPKCLSLVRLDESSRAQEIKGKLDVLSSWDKREETFSSADISGSIVDESLIPSVNSTFSDTSSLPLPGNTSSDELSLSFVPEVETNRQRDSHTRVSIEPQGKVRFSVFVSYAEIYNELIYDLLDKPPLTKHARRNALKLAEDKSKRHHIKGLKEIEVRNADEAFKLLQIGQINRQVASTRLNQRSSRSHAIFTIKVLRVVDINGPTYARVSSMSFVDLAGSERNREKDGVRMKEACNINTSLLTLGKCIEIMRFNQRNRCNAQRLVPFRESKLTRLFMGFFQGEGRVTMIVNINQIASMFDETYRVLRFSALARELVPGGHRPARHTGSAPAAAGSKLAGKEAGDRDNAGDAAKVAELGKLCAQHEGEIDGYRKIVQSLRDELRQARMEKIEQEVNIRREAAEEMANQLIEIEEANQERVAEAVSAVEERHEQQLEILSKSIKRRYVKKRRRPDSDEEFEGNLVKFRGQHDAEKWQAKCKQLEEEKMTLEEELTERNHQLEREKSVLQYELSGKMEDAVRCDDLSQKCAQLEQTISELTQKLTQETARYGNLQEELGRIHHDTNEEIQRKNAMAATIEEQTRELLKARADIMQLRHEKVALNEKVTAAALTSSSRSGGAVASKGTNTDGKGSESDHIMQLNASLEEAQTRVAQQDAEHAKELEQVNGHISEISDTLRMAQDTLESYEEQLLQLKEALAQKKLELQEFEERHDSQLQQIQALESAAAVPVQPESQGVDAAGQASAEIEQLKAQLEALQCEHVVAMKALKSAHAAALETLNTDHSSAVEALETKHTSRVESMQHDHASTMERLESQHISTVERLESKHASTIEGLEGKHAAAMEGLETRHMSTVEAMQHEHASAIAAVNLSVTPADGIKKSQRKPRATAGAGAASPLTCLSSPRLTRSAMKKCAVMLNRVPVPPVHAVPLESSVDAKDDAAVADALDKTQDLDKTLDLDKTAQHDHIGDVSAAGEDVVDPDLVYDMETSVHEERDVTPGLGKKRKRFNRQCKKAGKEGAAAAASSSSTAATATAAAAKRTRKAKDPKSSESAIDSDCENTSVFSAAGSSLVSLITSPFTKSGIKNSVSSTEKTVSPLAPIADNTAGGPSRPRTRRKLLGKSQISSPISIPGCGPAIELTSRRQRR